MTDGSNFIKRNHTRYPDGSHGIKARSAIDTLLASHTEVPNKKTPYPPGYTPNKIKRDHPDAALTDEKQYASLRGSVQYIAGAVRADVALAASLHGQTIDPTAADMRCMEHTLGYLQATRDKEIRYTIQPEETRNILTAYSDAAFANNDEAKSQTGYCIYMNGGLVAWKSTCQTYTSLSTGDAEICAASSATREIDYLRNLVEEFGTPQPAPTPLLIDALAAWAFFTNPGISERTKHMQVKYFHLKQAQRDRRTVDMQHVPGADNPSDALTKALSAAIHERHAKRMVSAVRLVQQKSHTISSDHLHRITNHLLFPQYNRDQLYVAIATSSADYSIAIRLPY